MSRSFWSDCSGVIHGNGSEEYPLTYQQLRNYFNPDIGASCEIVPQANDIINMYGIINLIDNDTVFSIKREINGKIIVKSPGLTVVPWGIETIDNINTELYLLKNVSGYNISTIELRDFVLCQNNDGDVQINMSEISEEDKLINVILRNFMVSAKKDIKIYANKNVSVKCYGYTFIGDNLILAVSTALVDTPISWWPGNDNTDDIMPLNNDLEWKQYLSSLGYDQPYAGDYAAGVGGDCFLLQNVPPVIAFGWTCDALPDDAPTISYIVQNEFGIQFVDRSTEAISWHWDFGDDGVNELIGWWKGEDDTIDSVGSNNAYWFGGGSELYDVGFINRCFKFIAIGGESLHINLKPYDFLTNQYFNIEFYIQPVISSDLAVFIMNIFGMNGLDDIAVNFINNPSTPAENFIRVDFAGLGVNQKYSSSKLNNNTWHKVVIQSTEISGHGHHIELYLDDVLQTPDTHVDFVQVANFNYMSFAGGMPDTAYHLLDEIKISSINSTSNSQVPPLHYYADTWGRPVYTVQLTVNGGTPISHDLEITNIWDLPVGIDFGWTCDSLPDDSAVIAYNIQNADGIQFVDRSPGAVLWHWDFGDGTTSDLEVPPLHYYPEADETYTITCLVNNYRLVTHTVEIVTSCDTPA